MSRFGWAYVNDVITGSGGGTPGGSDKAIQFASGSTFSGSTNFTFDYNTNTVRLTGTLYADNLIVSSSTIYKSGSTKFGDDSGDTHQFTGSVYVVGNVSASTDIYSAASIQVANNVTATNGTISSSLGFLTSGSIQSVGNITTTAGTVSASLGVNTAGTINAGSHITSTGIVSSSTGLSSGGGLNVAGVSNLKNDLVVTGTIHVSGNVQSTGMIITTTGFSGSGLSITDLQGYNVYGVGDDYSLQYKSATTGKLTGSSNLLFSGSTLTLTGSLLMSGTSYISEVDYIDFDVSASSPSWKNGRVSWNDTDGCLNVYNAESAITLQVGQENWVKVRNQTGSPITDGSVVRFNGAVGDVPSISLAQSTAQTASANENDIIGVATHTIEHGTNGYVTTLGLVRDLNTAAFAVGDLLWVSSSAGQFTNVKPSSPYDKTFVGVVTRANPSNGSIFVYPNPPVHIHDLSDTTITSRQNGDLLTYNSSSQIWQNSKILSGSYTIAGDLVVTGTMSASTAQFTTLIGSTITGSIGQFTALTASNITVVSGTINSRGIPNVLPTSIRRTIQVFPGAGSMVNSMNPINNLNDTPFTQGGTPTQGFVNGSAAIAYSVVSSTTTYGITTPDVGSTKVLCTSQRGPSWRGTFRTGNDLTQTRIFAGFEEYAGDKSTDDPTNGYAHLSYSSVRGDTTFKMITRTANGVGTQAILDTGISASVSTNYYFDMTLSSGSYNVTLVSGSSTFIGSITSSLPNITASLGTCCAAKNTSGVSRNLSIYFLEFNDS